MEGDTVVNTVTDVGLPVDSVQLGGVESSQADARTRLRFYMKIISTALEDRQEKVEDRIFDLLHLTFFNDTMTPSDEALLLVACRKFSPSFLNGKIFFSDRTLPFSARLFTIHEAARYLPVAAKASLVVRFEDLIYSTQKVLLHRPDWILECYTKPIAELESLVKRRCEAGIVLKPTRFNLELGAEFLLLNQEKLQSKWIARATFLLLVGIVALTAVSILQLTTGCQLEASPWLALGCTLLTAVGMLALSRRGFLPQVAMFYWVKVLTLTLIIVSGLFQIVSWIKPIIERCHTNHYTLIAAPICGTCLVVADVLSFVRVFSLEKSYYFCDCDD